MEAKINLKVFKNLQEKIDRWLHPNKLKLYDLKFSRHMPHLKCLDTNEDDMKHLVVLASNEKEARSMRQYIIYEGLEG